MKQHISIIELNTEEESVLTWHHALRANGFSVSLFLSRRIFGLLKDYLTHDSESEVHVYDDTLGFAEIYSEVKDGLGRTKSQLVVLPRFYARRKEDVDCYKALAIDYRLCVGIFNYRRWFTKSPSILLPGFPYISLAQFKDWFYCREMLGRIHAFFVSEIERDSNNPLKVCIREATGRPVFDCPFKLPEGRFSPSFDYEFPRFVIPGKIQGKRRDYVSVLRYFSQPHLIAAPWELVLLGRPDGIYGKYVLHCARKINAKAGSEKVRYFSDYVSKEKFEEEMFNATHVLAPVNPSGYKMGKDSGAIYDVFKYNKIGIFDRHYFFDEASIVRKGVLCYSDYSEFGRLLDSIVFKTIDYGGLKAAVPALASYMEKESYIKYVGEQVDLILSSNRA